MSWFKDLFFNPHKCNFEEQLFKGHVTMYQVISFYKCKCGKERIKRVYYQGPDEGKVVYQEIDA